MINDKAEYVFQEAFENVGMSMFGYMILIDSIIINNEAEYVFQEAFENVGMSMFGYMTLKDKDKDEYTYFP